MKNNNKIKESVDSFIRDVTSIRKWISKSEVRRRLNEIIKMVNKSDISSIKEVIIQLIAVINDPKTGAKDLKNIIGQKKLYMI